MKKSDKKLEIVMPQPRLKELRKRKKKTQKEIADLIGVSEKTYRNYENMYISDSTGEYTTLDITYRSILILAKYYNVTTDYLLGVSDMPNWDYEEISSFTGLNYDATTNLFLLNRLDTDKDKENLRAIKTQFGLSEEYNPDFKVMDIINTILGSKTLLFSLCRYFHTFTFPLKKEPSIHDEERLRKISAKEDLIDTLELFSEKYQEVSLQKIFKKMKSSFRKK